MSYQQTFGDKKKIFIFVYSHCGTTILRSIIGHIDEVYEKIDERQYFSGDGKDNIHHRYTRPLEQERRHTQTTKYMAATSAGSVRTARCFRHGAAPPTWKNHPGFPQVGISTNIP